MNQITQHWSTIRDSYIAERATEREKRRNAWLEPDFLPAALEVIEKPVSPTARITSRLLMAGVVLTGVWLAFGTLDVVATAPGEVMPLDHVKVIQSPYAGSVRSIAVRDGDSVRRGQLLVELDPTMADADEAEAQKALFAAQLDIARYRAIVDGLKGGAGTYTPPAGASADVASTQQQLVAAALAAQTSQGRALAASRDGALADARAAERTVQTYSATAPMLSSQLEAVRALAARGFASRFRLLELERQQRSEQGSRQVASEQAAKGYSESTRLAQALTQSRQEALQAALQSLSSAQNDATVRAEALNRARQQKRLQRLVAPVDGTVQQLAVHTVGGVVETARPIMVIVPGGTMTVEAKVLNKDAGFVRVGQKVAVKVDAFPFSRYGTVPAHIQSISLNSVQDGDKSTHYVARIKLDQQYVEMGGKHFPLRAGMSVSADIRTGERSMLSYLLDPMTGLLSEAAHEQ